MKSISEFKNKIICGNALKVLKEIPDESIDVIITSPPYWGLRDYGKDANTIWDGNPNCEHEWKDIGIKKLRGSDASPRKEVFKDIHLSQGMFCRRCNAWLGQLGLEPNFNLYIKHLCDIFDEIYRVLKRSGSCWVNIGDTYISGGGYSDASLPQKLPPKSLALIPSRFAIEMQNRGWILRNDVIWKKLNAMPSSVEDRLNNVYEHLFHFVKSNKNTLWKNRKTGEWVTEKPVDKAIVECPVCKGNKKIIVEDEFFGEHEVDCYECNGKGKVWIWKGFDYYYELDNIREPHKFESIKRARKSEKLDAGQYSISYKSEYIGYHNLKEKLRNGKLRGLHSKGKNPGDIFHISTKPFKGCHFAVFPLELIDKPLRATLPKPDGIVLDPFAGRGTVGKWCKKNWGHYILIDINPEYCQLAYGYIHGQKHVVDEKILRLDDFVADMSKVIK